MKTYTLPGADGRPYASAIPGAWACQTPADKIDAEAAS